MKKISLFFTIAFPAYQAAAQHMDIEAMMKDRKLRINGGINANAIIYSSNAGQGRDPFTYMLSGSLNFGILGFNMPLSYTITNQGNALSYKPPIDFNRFSLAPKYKWIKAYIGDNAMSFSEYTVNGHPFRGLGVELTPKGPIRFAALGGRFLKAVAGDATLGLPAVYERWGYGAKVGYEKEKYKLEAVGFYARDRKNSIRSFTDVLPASNYVSSLKLSTTLLKNLTLEAEYAISVLEDHNPYLGLNNNDTVTVYNSTRTFNKAFNTRLNYRMGKANLGLVYENVDPLYRTFGSMFFNNDLENVGFTFARPFLKDKIAVATQLGYQRDNLNGKKNQQNVRLVGSINASMKVSERLNLNGAYSNFSATTNRRLSQFEYINMPEMVPADTMDYQQLSQTGNVNANYVLGKNKNQNVNFNYSIAGQANKQGDVIRKGQASTVQNYALNHSISFPSKVGLNTSLNYTTNTTGTLNNRAMGGAIAVSRKFFDNKLNTNVGVLYNRTTGSETSRNTVTGIKMNANYVLLEKHNLALFAVQMFRNTAAQGNINDLTINFNYSYSF